MFAAIGTQNGYLVGNLFGHRGWHMGFLRGNKLETDWKQIGNGLETNWKRIGNKLAIKRFYQLKTISN